MAQSMTKSAAENAFAFKSMLMEHKEDKSKLDKDRKEMMNLLN